MPLHSRYAQATTLTQWQMRTLYEWTVVDVSERRAGSEVEALSIATARMSLI